jgi:hypothetical protein
LPSAGAGDELSAGCAAGFSGAVTAALLAPSSGALDAGTLGAAATGGALIVVSACGLQALKVQVINNMSTKVQRFLCEFFMMFLM